MVKLLYSTNFYFLEVGGTDNPEEILSTVEDGQAGA